MSSIKNILMKRDEMTAEESDTLIQEAKKDLFERIKQGDMPMDFCEEWFGLEPDYLIELL